MYDKFVVFLESLNWFHDHDWLNEGVMFCRPGFDSALVDGVGKDIWRKLLPL